MFPDAPRLRREGVACNERQTTSAHEAVNDGENWLKNAVHAP